MPNRDDPLDVWRPIIIINKLELYPKWAKLITNRFFSPRGAQTLFTYKQIPVFPDRFVIS
jgi:hypothetical protein